MAPNRCTEIPGNQSDNVFLTKLKSNYSEITSSERNKFGGIVTDTDKLFNTWINTCPYSLKEEGSIKSRDQMEDIITYSDKIEHDQAYNNLITGIYKRVLALKELGIDIKNDERDSSLIDSLNAKIDHKKKYTFSILSKLIILCCFIILFLATIILKNQKLYYITFFIVILTVVLNFTIMKKNI